MSVVTGSNSSLIMQVVPNDTTGATNFELPFVSETFAENINPIISDAINSERSVLNARGGNIRADGGMTMELTTGSPALNHLFAHLLGLHNGTSEAYPVAAAIEAPAALAAAAVTRGTYYTSAGHIFLCVKSGTATSITLPTDVDGDIVNGVGDTAAIFQRYGESGSNPKLITCRGAKKLPSNPLKVFKTFSGDEDMTISFNGVKINSAEITVPQEGIATINFAALGEVSSSSEEKPTTIDGSAHGDAYTGYECAVLSDVMEAAVQSATITISNELDGDVFRLGSRYRHDVVPQRRNCSGNVVLYLENLDAYDQFKNETTFELEFFFAYKGRYVSIEFPAAKFLGGSPTPQVSGNGVVTVPVDFQVIKGTAPKAYDVQITRTI